jgi:hypothetical protein
MAGSRLGDHLDVEDAQVAGDAGQALDQGGAVGLHGHEP